MGQFGIVGGGQGGLVAAIGLLQNGHEVTLYTNRSPEEIRKGRVTSNQTLFHPALEIERELGIHFWEDETYDMTGFRVFIDGPDEPLFLDCRLGEKASSVDQRLKFARWIEYFQRQGGEVVLDEVTREDIPDLTRRHEVIVVSTGKGELGRLFERDPDRSAYEQPARQLALAYLRGLDPEVFWEDKVNVMIVPGVGEMFATPCLTTTRGVAYGMVVEAIPGGPLDRFREIDIQSNPQGVKEAMVSIIEEHMPLFARGVTDDVRLADDMAVLTGGYPPSVRVPYASLDNDTMAIGIGDAVILNDPIVGQGANNATKHAWRLVQTVEDHEGDYDRDFAEEFSESHWKEYGQYATRFSNSFLEPPADHVQELFGCVAQDKRLGYLLAEGFADPSRLEPWYFDPGAMKKLLEGFGYR